METLIILAAVSLANWALHKWVLKPERERAKAAAIGDVALPRATEDAPVPLIYGRCKVTGGNVVWMGKLTNDPITDSNGDVVGYHYFLPFQMVLGIPGGTEGARLGYIWRDDKLIGFGIPWLETAGEAFLEAGVDDIGGTADWYGGAQAAGYTSSGLFESYILPAQGEDPAFFPTYRGFALITFYSHIAGQYGFAMGASTSPGALAFEVMADCAGLVDASLGAIGDGDANPANVLFDLLTSKFGRLGIDPARIDLPSFLAAGTIYASEQHGFSLVIYSASDARAIIREVLAETASVLYEDPETGLIVLKAIRNDYAVFSLPSFGPANVVRVASFGTSTWAETYNEVRVVYRDREQSYTERTAFSTDLANYTAQGARSRVLELRYPGISNRTTAAFAAARELRAVSRPLRRARLEIDRSAFSLRPGGAFKFSWPDYGGLTDLVMRVQKFDLGAFDSNTIAIDAIEDVFTFDQPHLRIPPRPLHLPSFAFPLEARTFDEAPRWLQSIGVAMGRLSDIDTQHAWYLAAPGPNDATVIARVSDGTAPFTDDSSRHAFLGTGVLTGDYPRTADPYDTTTGIDIEITTGFTPSTLIPSLAFTVEQQIQRFGPNLIRIDDEIMAFETAVDLSGGAWRLTKVWRGLLDTAVADHLGGISRVYFLSKAWSIGARFDMGQLGAGAFAVGAAVVARQVPYDAGGVAISPESSLPVDVIQIRGRTLLPYPVADLTLDASKTPAALQEEGTSLRWKARDRLKATIARGDAALEAVESGTTWDLRAEKLGLAPRAAVDLQTGLTVAGTAGDPQVTRAPLGKAGHGLLSVQVRSQNANGRSWQDAALPITAYHWRNLLLDPRWAFNDGSWSVITGTGTVAATGGLGNGPYVTGATGAVNTKFTLRQTRDVTGYNAVRLLAHVAYYATTSIGGDTSKLTITALDAGGSSLGTVTATVSPGATWARYELTYPDLPAGTISLRVELEATSATPFSVAPAIRYAETCLRLGQGNGVQQLANADFETGLASWTTAAGALAVSATAPLYLGAQYLIGSTASATNTIRQDVNLPAGYEFGIAVFECGRGQPTAAGAANTGEVKLQALDGGGSVLATSTTGAETFTADTWTRRRLTLEIPAATAKLRVEFTEVAGAAGSKRAAIDDCSWYAWKHLDPDTSYVATFTAPPAQPLPADRTAWEVAFSGCRAPDLLILDGSSTAPQFGSFDLVADVDVFVGATFVGAIDASGANETTCFDFSASYHLDAGLRDVHGRSNPAFANFGTSDRWCAMVVFKSGDTPSAGDFGLIGRDGSGLGWRLFIRNGVGVAEIIGDAATITVTGGTTVTDGAIHYLAIAYDGTSLHLYDEAGDHSAATAAATFYSDSGSLEVMHVGRANTSESTFAGQIARVYMWSRLDVQAVAAPTYAEIASTWTHGTDPTFAISSYTRAGGTLAVPALDDAIGGARVARYSSSQVALAYAGGGYGMASVRPTTNLCPDQFQISSSHWITGGSPTLSHYGAGPEGMHNATIVQGTSADYLEMKDIAAGAVAATVYAVFYVRSADATAHTMRSRLVTDAGVTSDTFDVAVTADGKWQRVAHAYAWSGATALARLRFFGSNSGASALTEICGPFYVGKDGHMPLGFATGAAAASAYASIAHAFPTQLNAEGELVATTIAPEALPVAGTLAALRNGASANDKRRLYVGASSATKLDHYDGAAAATTATTSGGGIVASRSAAPITERGRWNQASTFEGAAIYSEVRADALAFATGRAAIWTRGSAVMAQLDIGHDNGADVFAGGISEVRVWTRETKL